MTTVTDGAPVTNEAVTTAEATTVTDLATPPLRHARLVTAGAAANATAALAALRAFGLMPDQLAGESAHLLAMTDFDAARAVVDQNHQEEEPVATALDTAPQLDMSPAVLRAWAATRDLDVSPKGPVPRSIVDAYVAANGTPGTLAAEPKTTPVPAPAPKPGPSPAPKAPAVTIASLRAELERLETALTKAGHARAAAQHNLTEARAETERLRHDNDQLRENLRAAEHRLELPCPSTHCGEEAVCPAAPAAALPEPLADLVDAFHKLFARASELDTDAAHMLAEQLAPGLVRETADGLHHLIRLLDGDITP